MANRLALFERPRLAAAALMAILAAGTAAGPASEAAAQALTGTATYAESVALPENAIFEATVRDVTRYDRPSELIGRTRIEPIQEMPIRFAIPYDPRLIKLGNRYTIQARIIAGGRLLFATTDPIPVFEDGRPTPVDLLLPRSSGVAVEETPPPPAPPTLLGPSASPPSALTAPPTYSPPAYTPPAYSPPAYSPPAYSPPAAYPGPSTPMPGGMLGTLPASYSGILPCADCEGIRHDLDLWPDGSFALRVEYLGRAGNPAFVYNGRWVLDGTEGTLTLSGDRERPLAFAVKDTATLRLLDGAGREIVSNLNYDLVRSGQSGSLGVQLGRSAPVVLPPPAASATAPGHLLRGLFAIGPSGVQFVECGGSRPIAVATQGESRDLEGAYQRSARQPGEATLVEVQGRIAFGPLPGGDRLGRVLVVDRFIGLRPGETCTPAEVRANAGNPGTEAAEAAAAAPSAAPDAPLRNTYWKLIRIGSQTVSTPPGGNEPHLVLNPDIQRFSGHGGCNGIGGDFFLDGHYLTFSPGPSTLMVCDNAMEQERAYREVLARTEGWSVAGDRLTLYDRDGNATLRYQAGYR